ncbi:MAG: DegV family protein [Lachnospiraceae bacterium]|nr:DegV family protein [Lachnospiraceae bacterium]
MKSIGIITDSHSGITQEEAKQLGIWVLPMPFYIDGECYLEGINLTREEFFEKLEGGSAIATSQPSPADVCDVWDWALKEFEKVLYLPLSSGLSGSCETAMALARDEQYEGKILVVDHGQISTPLHQMVLDTLELIYWF